MIKTHLQKGVEALTAASQFIGMNAMSDLNRAVSCSVPYLRLWGVVAGGWQMARAAQISAAKIAAGDAVVEVGPGLGTLPGAPPGASPGGAAAAVVGSAPDTAG